jgi:uncharacterized protein involved in exopolysaccharide biosynthesis
MVELKREARRSDGMRRIVRTLFEWPGTALAFFVIFFGFLMLIAYLFPPLYEARALVLVKSGAEKSPLVYLPLGRAPIGNLTTSQEDVNSEVAILSSRPVIEEVVDRRIAAGEGEEPATGARLVLEDFQEWCRSIGLLPVVDDRETSILALQNNISIEPVPVSNVIEISYLTFSPKGAARTINFLLDAYLRRHGETHRNPDSLEFFLREAEDIRLRLETVRNELTQFRVDNDGGDLTLKRSLLLTQLVNTQQMRRTLESVSEGEEELLSDTSLLENRELSTSRERLLDLKLALAERKLSFSEGSTQIEGLTSQIEIARQALADQIARLRSSLARDELDLSAQLKELEPRRSKYDDLVDDEKRLQQNFDTYTAKAEEERVNKAMDASQMISVRVLERAAVPAKPYFPNRLMLAILGIVFGVPGAISAALLKGYLYGRVATVEDVEEELGIDVLASVRRRPWWSFSRKMPVDVVNAARSIQSTLAAPSAASSNWTGASSKSAGSRSNVVYFASATRREGAATLARAVAQITAAERGGKSVLVELGNAPDGARTAAVAARAPDAVLASAKRAADAPGLDTLDLSEARLVALAPTFAALRQNYDHIFVSGPPLTGRSDGASYLSLADRSVFVVSGSGVHLEVARRALSLLRQHSRDIVGAVLTQRREAVPALIYRWM